MGRRIHDAVRTCSSSEYDGRRRAVWAGVDDGDELYARLRTLPGYGDEKAQDLRRHPRQAHGRRSRPAGSEAAGPFGDDVPRSVADIADAETLAKVREWKQAAKAAKRDKQDRPLG